MSASRLGQARMAGFCRRQSYRGRVDPGVLAARLKDNLLTGAPGTVTGKAHSAVAFAELLALLNRQLSDYLARVTGASPASAMTIPSSG